MPGLFATFPITFRDLSPTNSYTGANGSGTFTGAYAFLNLGYAYINDILGFSRIPRYVTPQTGLANAWDAPFFYEDRRYLFYVTTDEEVLSFFDYTGFGTRQDIGSVVGQRPFIPPLVLSLPPIPKTNPIAIGSMVDQSTNGLNVAPVQDFLARSATIRAALGTSLPLSFQGQEMHPSGSIATN